MHLKPAQKYQINDICDLVNLAYRGEQGWTTETDLVHGNRCTPSEVNAYLSNTNTHLRVLTKNQRIQACICIENKNNCAYIGFFAVHPDHQEEGIGKAVLKQAESFAKEYLKLNKYIMVVISQRTELIEYYERRGYIKTGKHQDYPTNLQVGTPIRQGLTVEYLEKNLC